MFSIYSGVFLSLSLEESACGVLYLCALRERVFIIICVIFVHNHHLYNTWYIRNRTGCLGVCVCVYTARLFTKHSRNVRLGLARMTYDLSVVGCRFGVCGVCASCFPRWVRVVRVSRNRSLNFGRLVKEIKVRARAHRVCLGANTTQNTHTRHYS